MTTLLFLAITGWLTAAFLALAYYSCRQHGAGWKRLYEQKCDQLKEVEHRNMVADMNAESLQWHKDEVARLSAKCHAICRQARKMKGRGRVTCQSDPMHNF